MNLPVNDDAEEGAADPTAGPPSDAENQPSHSAGPPSAVRVPVNRRTLDEVFGDVLPSTTRDEGDESPDEAARDNHEQWYRDNRPPHHG